VSGSVPSASLAGNGPIALTLADAIRHGLEANLGPITATDASRYARAQRLQALSSLLPSIGIDASDTVTQVNLAAYGFQFKLPPGSNLTIPSVVGPFNYSSLAGNFNLPIFDAVSIWNLKSAKALERSSVLSAQDARQVVIFAIAGAYLQTVATEARVASQQAQVANAQAIYNQALTRKEAGTTALIDVTRSLVELQTEQQRLTSLQSDVRKQKLVLARAIGLPLSRDPELTEKLTVPSSQLPDLNAEIQRSYTQRADLHALEGQVEAARQALSAARSERLPSLTIGGDYGVLGPNPAHTHGVFAVTGSLNIPVFEGGRISGDIQQAQATLHQRQAELADARGSVEQDVRTAFIDLETATGQVRVADNNRRLANDTLAQARDRFNAGVATTVEVVQAQEQVASAETDYTSSLFSYGLASAALARATGDAEMQIPELLKGKRP
jgi:outer membrane protein TolC